MNIIQINTLAKNNSTGRTTYEMHQWLSDNGHRSTVIASALSYTEEQYGQKVIGNKFDMKMHALLSRLTGLQGYFSAGATRKAVSYIESVRPDAVIIRVLHSNFIHISKLLKYLKKEEIPTIIVLHDLWFTTGHCTYPISEMCESYKYECRSCPQIKCDNASWIFDTSHLVWKKRKMMYSQWRCLAFVGVSKWAYNCVKESSAVDIKNNIIDYVYNWINRDVFKPIQSNDSLKNKPYTVMGVSTNWTTEKGIMDFWELADLLTDEQIVLVGAVDEEIKNAFLGKKVRFVEFTNSVEALAELYNSADVYVSLSKQETFGKTIAEAICCGTPAVVYNTTACPELIEDGCGYVVAFGDVKAVRDKILLIREEGKEKYKSNCLKKAQKDFDLDKNMNKYIEIVESLK